MTTQATAQAPTFMTGLHYSLIGVVCLILGVWTLSNEAPVGIPLIAMSGIFFLGVTIARATAELTYIRKHLQDRLN